MTRAELDALKTRALQHKERASDMDVVAAELLQLPPGQLKKVLTEDVRTVLRKYGYAEE